ncbi:Hypothetical protein A7982_02161 [Minicystis rosea]|nr:Hypothetical protein A7982_02161 [Minicystis rosea]
MSLLFGIDMLFPRPRLRAAVEALARLADRDDCTGCIVVLPGEQPIPVPFDAYAEDEDGPLASFDCSRADRFQCLDGSLWLPIDDDVRAYLKYDRRAGHAPALRTTRGGEEASIGRVSIHIYCGARHSVVHVGAATSSMSYLFESSGAIRRTFLELVRETGGFTALLNREAGAPDELLGAPGQYVKLPRYDWEDPIGTVDRFVDTALAAEASRA